METYKSFEELDKTEEKGEDYEIHMRAGTSGIAVMAPHGGGIEPGTTEIADSIAGEKHAFYSFEGLKKKGNFRLHITSRRFDEPGAMDIAGNADTIVTVHGCRDSEEVVFIGGRDTALREKIKEALISAGFTVRETPRFPGMHPANICNRCRLGRGVQIEISLALRRRMFNDLRRHHRKGGTGVFDRFVASARGALMDSKNRRGPDRHEKTE